MSCVLSSLPIAHWLESGLHLKCVRADGSAEINQELRSYLTFLSEMPTPVLFNVPLFFSHTFKPLVLELCSLFFAVNDADLSFFIGDILNRLLQGGSDAAKIAGSSLAQKFFVNSIGPRDLCTLDLLKQFAIWHQQTKDSLSRLLLPSTQAEYESQHPYSQEGCTHLVSFPDDVKHMEVTFDSRSQTSLRDSLFFRYSSKEKILQSFSGNPFANSPDSDITPGSGSIVFAGNKLEAIFECVDSTFEEQQALWGYKFIICGFSVAPDVRQSLDAVCGHIKSLFQDLLMTVCSKDDGMCFRFEALDSDILVNESSIVFSENLLDMRVRKSLEHIFFEEMSGLNASNGFINVFRRTIHFAALKYRAGATSCGRCTAGHTCKIINGIPLEPMYHSGFWSCDICKKSMARGQANVWHCSTCQFDVCPGCQNDLLEKQHSEFNVGDVVHLVPPAIADYRQFSDASSGPMILGVEYPIQDVRPPHVNVQGSFQL
jgi:hypothetical protein